MCRTSASRFLSGMAPSVLSQRAVRPRNGTIFGRERRFLHEIAGYQDFTKNNGLFSTKQHNSWKFCLPRAHLREICGRSARNLNINCPAVRQEALFTHGIDFCVLPCVRTLDSRTECLSDALPGNQPVLFTAWRHPCFRRRRSVHEMAPFVLSQRMVRPRNGAICGRERRSFHEIACYQDFTKNNGLFSTKQQNSWKFCLPRADSHEICGRSARNLNINCPARRSASPLQDMAGHV